MTQHSPASRALMAIAFTGLLLMSFSDLAKAADTSVKAEIGPRPFYLLEDLEEGPLKEALSSCKTGPFYRTDFSIAHRGAPLQFPEHTKQSYEAAARMGAGIIECDATFTKDQELVCRHSQCDLHQTTDILLRPDLAGKCTQPFSPAGEGSKATAKCCTSDITLSEFYSLNGKMDGVNTKAKTVQEYVKGTSPWRTDLYATKGTLLSHADSIDLIDRLGAKFIPELKKPAVSMPYQENFSQEKYAQKLVDAYKEKGIDPSRVFLQSFNLDDVLYWIKNEPDFGKQATYLDGRYRQINPSNPDSFSPTMQELADQGVKILAPPIWMLLDLNSDNKIVPSAYALEARKAGLSLIGWSLERSGPMQNGGGWYYKAVKNAIKTDGDILKVLDILAKEVGVKGIFSDWPATSSFYASCKGLN
jgi:glycerophosphoryl diester phosphodiesterase